MTKESGSTTSVTLAALLFTPNAASAFTTINGVARRGYDGLALLDDQIRGPAAGYEQSFEIALSGGSSPAWSFMKKTGFTLASPYDSDLSIETGECFADNAFCGIGGLSNDGLTFTGQLKTYLPTPPNEYGFYSSQQPSQLFVSAQVVSPTEVPYRITIFDPVLSSSVPEPATWLMMLAGFAAVGLALQRRHKPRLSVSHIGASVDAGHCERPDGSAQHQQVTTGLAPRLRTAP